jgi:hypothetical protein
MSAGVPGMRGELSGVAMGEAGTHSWSQSSTISFSGSACHQPPKAPRWVTESPRERLLRIEAGVEREVDESHARVGKHAPQAFFQAPSAHVGHHALALQPRKASRESRGRKARVSRDALDRHRLEQMALDIGHSRDVRSGQSLLLRTDGRGLGAYDSWLCDPSCLYWHHDAYATECCEAFLIDPACPMGPPSEVPIQSRVDSNTTKRWGRREIPDDRQEPSWIEADPIGWDAPISVWWDHPPGGDPR